MDNLADKAKDKRGAEKVSTKAAVVILFAVAAVVAAIVVVVLHMAKADNTSTLSDTTLTEALEDTEGVTPVEAGGKSATDATITTTAVFVTDGQDSDTLSGLYLVALNETQNKGYLVSIDPATKVVADDETTTTLAALYADKGATGTIPALAEACALPLAHAVEIDASNWDLVMGALSGGTAEIVSNATELLGAVKSDMDATTLAALADEIHSMGLSSLDKMDCPVSEGMIDAVALDTAVGAIE